MISFVKKKNFRLKSKRYSRLLPIYIVIRIRVFPTRGRISNLSMFM